jgi:hypothetical protein
MATQKIRGNKQVMTNTITEAELFLSETAQWDFDETRHGFVPAPPGFGYTLTSDGWIPNPEGGGVISGPQAFGDNYVITPSVAANNLTLALKTIAAADPSAGDPITVRIGDTKRTISAAISVTKNAGTNWCNAGGTELASQVIDFFVYVIQETGASAGTKIGFSRIPYAKTMSDFVNTTTSEKYIAGNWTNFNATDEVENIGRFAAQLSATASFNWSIATAYIINRPIYETRWLAWNPVLSISAGTYTSTSFSVVEYMVSYYSIFFRTRHTGTASAGAGTTILFTLPFEVKGSANNPTLGASLMNDSAASYFGGAYVTAGTPDKASQVKYNLAAFAAGTVNLGTNGSYAIE